MNKNTAKRVSGRNKNTDAKRLGENVNLIDWLNRKDKDGNLLTDGKIVAELLKGKQTKGDGKNSDRVMSITSDNWTLTVEVAKRKVPATKDGVLYEQEYASLLPLTAEAATDLMGGKLDVSYKDDAEVPSVIKYFRQGYGMLARNSAGANIASQIEGPAKGREAAINKLIKLKGWDRAKAEKKYDAMMADD